MPRLLSCPFAELLSPSTSSCADLSSPDPNDLQRQQQRRYPRGIVNPNYPGFQHLAHTLAEHFIDHHHQFEPSSDSEISEDFDFDVAYRSGNLGNVNIMNDISDSNNNNGLIDNRRADGSEEKVIDLNRNKNRRSSSCSKPENDFGSTKEYEDGNDNLLMKSKPKVFCESKQLGLNDSHHFERFSSEDEDEECCNVSSTAVLNSFKIECEPSRMEFDEDDIADLSGEDDAAIKNELENIDKADNDFGENNINCDLATYLQQYDYKLDVQKLYESECLTDEDNSKLPTPDILIEHNSKKLQNGDENPTTTVVTECDAKSAAVDVSPSDEMRDYQPDLIKNITDAINANDDNNRGDEEIRKIRRQSAEGDNGIPSHAAHDNEKKTDDDDEKIINQVQTETAENADDKDETIEINSDESRMSAVSRNLPLSFESATSTTVDIIGDFGKEVEKEIGLIASGYRNATNEMCEGESSSGKKAQQPIRPGAVRVQSSSTNNPETVFDEHKFIEHLKYFSKVSATRAFFHIFEPSRVLSPTGSRNLTAHASTNVF